MGGYGGVGMTSAMDAAKAGARKPKKKSWGEQRSTQPIPSSAHERGPIRDFSPKNLPQASPSSYRKGGRVKKSGMAEIEKGERVLTAKEAKAYDRVKKVSRQGRKANSPKGSKRKSSTMKRAATK